MWIIKTKTLKEYLEKPKYRKAKNSIEAWIDAVKHSTWGSPQELKQQFRAASIIDEKRVVFNIKGNEFRLVVNIEYRFHMVFVIWFGTHDEYNKIDVKNINYEN